jgi:hypothetical protein
MSWAGVFGPMTGRGFSGFSGPQPKFPHQGQIEMLVGQKREGFLLSRGPFG